MSACEKNALKRVFDNVSPRPEDEEMALLEKAVRPLMAEGFEFRGGDFFGQEIFSIYVNDNTDEFAILRYNRPKTMPDEKPQPLILRGPLTALDTPMEHITTLPFIPVREYLTPENRPLPASTTPSRPNQGSFH